MGSTRPRRVTSPVMATLPRTGRPDSAQRRLALLKRLELPEHMTANALLEVLNTCYTREEALLFLEEK